MGVDFSDAAALRKKIESGTLVPSELAIETVFGCNAKCTMCFIDEPTARKKRVMKRDLYNYIIDVMEPYGSKLDKFDLWCLGEPLIDPYIVERAAYAKKKGFANIALATNAEALYEKNQQGLLDAGVDTVIISIDAVKPETHAKIRRGLHFDQVVKNCEDMIERRNNGGYRTRFLFRFVAQGGNRAEWPAFKRYWAEQVSEEKFDNVVKYPAHNWGGLMGDKQEMLGERFSNEIERAPCKYVFESLLILADGTLTLCPADFLKGEFGLGRVPEMSPIEAFNSPEYKRHRDLHLKGEKNQIKLCETCTILYSNDDRDYAWEQKSHTFKLPEYEV